MAISQKELDMIKFPTVPMCWKCPNVINDRDRPRPGLWEPHCMIGCAKDHDIKSYDNAKTLCPVLVE